MRLPYHKTLIAVCLLGFLICMALIFGGCSSSVMGKSLNVAVVGSGIADLVTTRQALNRGAIEANGLAGQGAIRQAVLKSLGVGAVVVISRELDRQHPRWAHVVRGISIGAWTSAAIWNATRMR